jgi:hypothetical protein
VAENVLALAKLFSAPDKSFSIQLKFPRAKKLFYLDPAFLWHTYPGAFQYPLAKASGN